MLSFDAIFSFFHLEWQLLLKEFGFCLFVLGLNWNILLTIIWFVCYGGHWTNFSIACGQYTSDLAF